jgi:hAT family C-terminal dimerisation region
LAKWALSISPTIGATERNWSAFGYIYSKNRNSLLNDRVNKLVYIYWNLQIRERIGDKRDTWFDDKEDKDKEKDKDLVEALFEPDVYKFDDDEVD